MRDVGDWDGLIAACQAQIERWPDDVTAHVDLSDARHAKGDIDGAVVAWREALRLYADVLRDRPTDLSALRVTRFILNRDDDRLRDPPRAVEVARRIIELTGEKATYADLVGLARAHYRAGDWEAAAIAADKALRAKSNGHPQAQVLMALSHARRGDLAAARTWYDHAARWMDYHPPGHPDTRGLRAEAAALLGIPYAPDAGPAQASDKPGTSDG